MIDAVDRILPRLQIEPPGPLATSCWLFLGPTNGCGYGRIAIRRGQLGYVHRLMYEAFIGPIATGKQIDHLCRHRLCCNPSHLEPVTPRENTLRGDAPMAIQARRPTCIHGHLKTPDNVYHTPSGKPMCRPCLRSRAQELYRRRHGETARMRGAAQGTCQRGHPRTADNMYQRKDRTGAMCRLCQHLRYVRQHDRHTALQIGTTP